MFLNFLTTLLFAKTISFRMFREECDSTIFGTEDTGSGVIPTLFFLPHQTL